MEQFKSKIFIPLLIFMILCFVGLVNYYELNPVTEYVYVEREVEIPVEIIKEVPKIEIQVIEVPQPFPVYVYNTTVIYVPTPMSLSDWENENELMTFIREDKTNHIKYSTDFDCDDFTLRVIHNAAEIGRRVYYFYEWTDPNPNNNHIMCMAYVIEEAEYIIWEPQTDQIWSRWSSCKGG
jgi:hypothetical protein